ncbi:hypothetical protein KFK09_006550 [Dendrobium nobile]|uniref:Aminotransferase-like plant mobile domain-containing protein n=1 Tax=Dendrobium nobile TaxID=94219 RepID=A0A8T3BRP0_DENNO|nr:hypothetical protein KFK09_006550 [Dendrobium nobile]
MYNLSEVVCCGLRKFGPGLLSLFLFGEGVLTEISSEGMFRWQRPDDLPPGEPSEDAIWEAIDRQDPQGSIDVRDRLEQHQDMLRGRDIFHDFFARSPLLPELPVGSVSFENPERWVTSLRLQYGEYHPLESSLAQVGWGTCDVLVPAADTLESIGQSSLLSHRQLQSSPPLEWQRDSTVGQIQSPVSSYVSWARYVLQVHRETLRAAGIYEAVYVSLFDYGRLPSSWARGLIEFWDAGRGTCWIGAEELTVTLSDLQMVSGLPVFGHSFEECVPPDEQLFHRVPSLDGDRRGRLLLPDVYPRLLQHYRQTFRSVRGLQMRSRATMPIGVWVSSFLHERFLFSAVASLHDPFDFGLQRGTLLTEETAEPFPSTSLVSPALPGVDEDLLLAGFLALWLSTFVLPLRTESLRCTILLAASQLSVGQRLSLAPAVLARVYRVLRTTSEAGSLDVRDSALPWQYLYAWIHLHVQGAFSCLETPTYFLQRGFPTVLQLFQASSTFESERIRLFFFAPQLVSDRFALVHQPDTVNLPPHQRGIVLVDGVDHRGRRTLLLRSQSLTVAEYFISMRPGWLCHCWGGFVTLEGYQPNRVARQFGFSQATAYDGRVLLSGVTDVLHMGTVPLETRFYVAAVTWAHLLRMGTGSSFLLAQPSTQTGVSYTRLSWVRLSFGPALEHGARRYERRVRELGSSRGRRSRRSLPEAAGDRGTHTEAHATSTDVVPSPARVPDVAPAPLQAESSRRRASSQLVTSSRRSVDARPSPRDLGESTQEPRRSDFTGYSTLDPSADFSFPVDPYGSFWPGESSGTGATLLSEFFGEPPHTLPPLGLVPTEFSFFPEGHPTDFAGSSLVPVSYSTDLVGPSSAPTSYPPDLTGPSSASVSYPADSAGPSTVPAGYDYTSEIISYDTLPPTSMTSEMCNDLAQPLRRLVFSIDPRSPESWHDFSSTANQLLGLLAKYGASTTELCFWEAVCREAESCIWHLSSLSITRSTVTLPEREGMVVSCRARADGAHDLYDRSVEILRRHRQSTSDMTREEDGVTTHMWNMWRDITQAMSQRLHIQDRRRRGDRLIRREEQRQRALQQKMLDADASLARAVEQFQVAQSEFQTLATVTDRLEKLRARLF